jgi:hypothetical protein
MMCPFGHHDIRAKGSVDCIDQTAEWQCLGDSVSIKGLHASGGSAAH